MASFDPTWFGYGALLVLLAASLVVRVDHVRIGLAVAALLALPVAIMGWSGGGYTLLIIAILLVNLGLIARLWLSNAKVSFTAEEQELRDRHFERLGAASARMLIDQGHWISARRGEMLIRENEAAPSPRPCRRGTATIRRDGAARERADRRGDGPGRRACDGHRGADQQRAAVVHPRRGPARLSGRASRRGGRLARRLRARAAREIGERKHSPCGDAAVILTA